MNSKPVFLDVDSSIIEESLRIADKSSDNELSKLFQPPDEQYPTKLIKPIPGFCIKTKEHVTGTKVFVNICQTDAIPPPEDIPESKLVEILNDSDSESFFKIPMSIAEIYNETDKNKAVVKVVDVAVNSSFLQKMETIPFFRDFCMAVVFEALQSKHDLNTEKERIILKNRKAFGNLRLHRVQQREMDQKMGKLQETEKSAIENLTGSNEPVKCKPMIETLTSVAYDDSIATKVPAFRLFKRPKEPRLLFAEVKLPEALSSKEITLDMGEDRMVLESSKFGYFLDLTIPYYIKQENVICTFCNSTKILTVTMPIKGG